MTGRIEIYVRSVHQRLNVQKVGFWIFVLKISTFNTVYVHVLTLIFGAPEHFVINRKTHVESRGIDFSASPARQNAYLTR